jgi:hypothetical protein
MDQFRLLNEKLQISPLKGAALSCLAGSYLAFSFNGDRRGKFDQLSRFGASHFSASSNGILFRAA